MELQLEKTVNKQKLKKSAITASLRACKLVSGVLEKCDVY